MIAYNYPEIEQKEKTVRFLLKGLANHPAYGALACTAIFTRRHSPIPDLHPKLHVLRASDRKKGPRATKNFELRPLSLTCKGEDATEANKEEDIASKGEEE